MKITALAPGFRFHPTDEELVSYYLKRKVANKSVRFSAISEVDIYKNEPWDLPDKSRLKTRDNKWYFLGALDGKYGSGARMSRATKKGYWKVTSQDRKVRRGSQTIAMKKTLVFYSRCAPGVQRTNWVMHEYRLVDEELEKIGGSQTVSYVLCKVFDKNNNGRPNGNHYVPFTKEELDDGQTTFIQGEDTVDDAATYNDNCSESNFGEKDSHYIHRNPLNINELPKDSENFDEYQRENVVMLKTEILDDCPHCMLNTEAPFPLLQYKRRKRYNYVLSNPSNASDNSTASNTATDTTIATSTGKSEEYSLMGSIERKEIPDFPLAGLDVDLSVHSGCKKLINDLQREVQKISVERESLKLELMSVHALVNILQSRIDFLKAGQNS